MVTPIEPSVMIRQGDRLADDLLMLVPSATQQIRELLDLPRLAGIDTIRLVGCGDSYHAGCAAEMAFETMAGIACEPVSARRFALYGVRAPHPGHVLVVGASASGRTPAVVAALAAARSVGAQTIALTGDPSGPVGQTAEHAVAVPLTAQEPSPGIRTYQATLLAMLILGGEMAARRGNGGADDFTALANNLTATAAMAKAICPEVAEAVAETAARHHPLLMIGGGPSYGTALYAAAKCVEAAGIAAVAQDPEEWWHVERRFRPADVPLLVIGAPGRSYEHTAAVAAAARRLDRWVVAVTGPGDTLINRHAHAVVPVAAEVREEYSALLYHVFAGYLGAFLAQRLGRRAFDGDPPGFPSSLNAFAAAAP